MESKDIKKILKEFQEKDTYKKIFINGRWGIGKSFYTKEFIKNEDDAVYISLFGKNQIEQIEEDIAKELFKKINSGKKVIKKVKELAKKISGSVSFYGISINSPSVRAKSFIEEYYAILEKEKNLIIVIDDLERKSSKIAIEDVLGIIEQLSLCKKIKIVLIGDEERINEGDKEIWKSFKEKIIEKEYKITKFSEEAIYSLVISKLNKYIKEEELKNTVKDFIEKFPVNNLRTINKAVNLFLEIISTYLYRNCEDINKIVLKSCMAIAIESTEKLFEPKEIDNDKEVDSYKSFESSLDQNMETRIERHYFNSYIITNKEAFLVHYVLNIFEGNHKEDLIEEMNKVIEDFLSNKDEKNIFYLDEKSISDIIIDKYKLIMNNEYNYTCLDELVDDIYNILFWKDSFRIKYNEEILKVRVKNILLENYYSDEKELYDNTIDRFSLRYGDYPKLKEYFDEYNKSAEERYYTHKMDMIELSFVKKEFDVVKLRWIENAFIQSNKETQFERFIIKARKNNYFISDLSIEISADEWRWNHYIWNVFYEYMSEEYKEELENYANSIKGKNKIQDIRIGILQENKPLIKRKIEKL